MLIKILTPVATIFIGVWQIKINTNQVRINARLKQLQDYVAIAVVPVKEEGRINLLNVGKINLYLWKFDMPGNLHEFEKPRLIAAGSGDAAYYWIPAPPKDSLKVGQEFEFKFYLTDEFDRQWVSEHGGSVDKEVEVEQDGKKVSAITGRVWSYRTYEKTWRNDKAS